MFFGTRGEELEDADENTLGGTRRPQGLLTSFEKFPPSLRVGTIQKVSRSYHGLQFYTPVMNILTFSALLAN